jgi:hypothetical protein
MGLISTGLRGTCQDVVHLKSEHGPDQLGHEGKIHLTFSAKVDKTAPSPTLKLKEGSRKVHLPDANMTKPSGNPHQMSSGFSYQWVSLSVGFLISGLPHQWEVKKVVH